MCDAKGVLQRNIRGMMTGTHPSLAIFARGLFTSASKYGADACFNVVLYVQKSLCLQSCIAKRST